MEFIVGLILVGFIVYFGTTALIWTLGAIYFYPMLLTIPLTFIFLLWILNKLKS
jgi:hypothetical protein